MVQQTREARAVDAEGATAAPQVGHADKSERVCHDLRGVARLRQMGKPQEGAHSLPASNPVVRPPVID